MSDEIQYPLSKYFSRGVIRCLDIWMLSANWIFSHLEINRHSVIRHPDIGQPNIMHHPDFIYLSYTRHSVYPNFSKKISYIGDSDIRIIATLWIVHESDCIYVIYISIVVVAFNDVYNVHIVTLCVCRN